MWIFSKNCKDFFSYLVDENLEIMSTLSALFYVNGALEGFTALIGYSAPHVITGGNKKLDESGAIYARRFSLLLGAFSVASLLIARQPDSPSKHIFSFGWLLFHLGTVLERTFRDSRSKIVPIFIHGSMAAGFVYYIYKSDMKKSTFMVWRIKDVMQKH